jgi:two-component system NtrC family sensor kinase
MLSGLRAKLILPYVLLTIATALVGVFIVTTLVTSSIQERFDNQLIEAGRVASDEIVRREQLHLERLRRMIFTVGVAEALAADDATALQAQLFPLALNSQIHFVSTINRQGFEVMSLIYNQDSDGYQVTGAQYFGEIEIIDKVLNSRSDQLGDKYVDVLPTVEGLFLMTAASVTDQDGQVVGAMMVGTNLARLIVDIKTKALADLVILSESGEFRHTTLPIESTDQEASSLEFDPALIGEDATSEIKELRLFGRRYSAVYTPLFVRSEQVGIMGILLPSNYIVSTMATSRTSFSLIFSIATVAVIYLGFRLAQSIAQPILKLRSMSQAVASGDLDQESNLKQSDEIGELASAFDVMTQRLRERTQEAARLYAESIQRNKELEDINARLQSTQAQLIQSEKLAAVGQLTAGIVHDVKNPLAVIKGLAEELEEEDNSDPHTRDGLRTIRESASKANAIVSDLLKFARQSKPEMQFRDLKDSIQAAIRLTEYLARKAKVSIISDLPSRAVVVRYDPQQIEQVLINLINNAVQAMPGGGTLRISLAEAEGAIAISVHDTGVGISPDNLQRIFDPFFTTKPEAEGTGLGLSVSYGIIAHHGGQIEVESELGTGSTFTVLLPVEAPLAVETG